MIRCRLTWSKKSRLQSSINCGQVKAHDPFRNFSKQVLDSFEFHSFVNFIVNMTTRQTDWKILFRKYKTQICISKADKKTKSILRIRKQFVCSHKVNTDPHGCDFYVRLRILKKCNLIGCCRFVRYSMSVDVNFAYGIKVLGLFIDNARRIFQDILCLIWPSCGQSSRSRQKLDWNFEFNIIIPNLG